MDNFTDKLASKFNAQEMIKANAQAEANEMNRLKEQVAAYEAIFTVMRKLNYKNSELTDKINALVDESITKFQSSRSEDVIDKYKLFLFVNFAVICTLNSESLFL